MIERSFNGILFIVIIFFCFFNNLHAQPLSVDMQRLCAMSEKEYFSPLVESIRSPNKDPLINGIELGSDVKETTKLLAGRHPDSIIVDKSTPLIFASAIGNWQAAKALLTAGADINYKAFIETTPLEMAVFRSQFPMACRLIEMGAKIQKSIDQRNDLMRYTLAMDPREGELGAIFIEYLLSNGFDVNEYGSANSNPLMGAVSLHNIPVIKVLLKHGARLDIVKQGGRTVWSVATEKNNPRVLQLLKEAQEKVDAAKKVKAPEPVHQ